MDSRRESISKCLLQLRALINDFQGADAFILEKVAEISALPPKIDTRFKVRNCYDAARLLSMVSLNTI